MKKISLVFLMFSLSIPASATTIRLLCQCSYSEEGISRYLMITGEDKDASPESIESCQIQNGLVVDGCLDAKNNARFNCREAAERFSGRDKVGVRISNCTGQITND